MAVETISAIFAASPWPSSMSFRVCERIVETRLVFGEPLRDARVEIPAEVIEFRGGGELFNFRRAISARGA